MAKKKEEAETPEAPETPVGTTTNPQVIVTKITEQVQLLIGRQWPDIRRIMDDDSGEIKLAVGVTITDRKATPGEQSDKDNRVRVTIAFAEKYSDSTETDLPDPNQPDLI
jgi:hypothetical protein